MSKKRQSACQRECQAVAQLLTPYQITDNNFYIQKMSKKSKKRQPITQLLAKYEKESALLSPKAPANARMKLHKRKPAKKHAITLKSLIYDDPDFGLVGEGPRRPRKFTTKAFNVYNPQYDETADFLKSMGLGYRRKRKGYY
jgi:hypothetical protein